MNKHYPLRAILIAFTLIVGLCAFPSAAAETPSPSASSAVLYEPFSRTFLYEKSADVRLPMASTTKIMTALTALSVLEPDEQVTVPACAVGTEGSSAYLEKGEVLSVEDLLYALLLASANDAAVVLAIAADGSAEAFAARMNALAAKMGLTQTHFENPHGLHSEKHYTTARELALIAAKLLENDTLRKIVSTKVYTAQTSLYRRTFVNHNKLLSRDERAIGVKTGFTKASGRCLVGAAEKDGMTLISVTLNAPNDWNDHEALWDFGFSNYELRDIVDANSFFTNVSVIGAILPYVKATNHETVRILCQKTSSPIEMHAECLPHVMAPIEKDTVLGYLCFTKDGKEVKRIPLYAANDMPLAKISKK